MRRSFHQRRNSIRQLVAELHTDRRAKIVASDVVDLDFDVQPYMICVCV